MKKLLLLSIIALQGASILAMDNNLECCKVVNGQKVPLNNKEVEFFSLFSGHSASKLSWQAITIDDMKQKLGDFPDFCTWRFLSGNTALHLLLIYYPPRTDLLQLLLKHGGDPYDKNNKGYTVFDLALGKEALDYPSPTVRNKPMVEVLKKHDPLFAFCSF